MSIISVSLALTIAAKEDHSAGFGSVNLTPALHAVAEDLRRETITVVSGVGGFVPTGKSPGPQLDNTVS
jgi:hypothetical protein